MIKCIGFYYPFFTIVATSNKKWGSIKSEQLNEPIHYCIITQNMKVSKIEEKSKSKKFIKKNSTLTPN